MGQSFDHRFHHSFVLYAIVVPRNDHGGRPAHGEWMLTTETSLHGRRSMVKAPSWRRLGRAPAQLLCLQGAVAPGASTPRARGRPPGRPATALGARASRLESRRCPRPLAPQAGRRAPVAAALDECAGRVARGVHPGRGALRSARARTQRGEPLRAVHGARRGRKPRPQRLGGERGREWPGGGAARARPASASSL